MSASVVSKVWKHSHAMYKERIMILALADCANDQGVCWPSVAHLAQKCRISESTAKRLIQKLVGRGELKIEKPRGTFGSVRRANTYRARLGNRRALLGAMPYQEYLNTSEWQDRRKLKLKDAGYRCQLRNSAGILNAHHRTYEDRGNEPLNDLIVLCEPCHKRFHGIAEVER
jgi:hypothetical protein